MGWKNQFTILFLVSPLFITSCNQATPTVVPLLPDPQVFTITKTVILPTLGIIPLPTRTVDPTRDFLISSPLEDINLDELDEIVSTPFLAPEPGKDSGHQGIDFAYYTRGEHAVMEGLKIYSILNGVVSGITNNVNPYGNMIIIETPLSTIPFETLTSLQVPSMLTPYPDTERLSCPIRKPVLWQEQPQSVYLLYGHMKNPTQLTIGAIVGAGNLIGQVGSTGDSGNPHLHLEVRFGPSGTKFASMGHYNTAISLEEMSEYCLWRISGQYQLADPMTLLQTPSPVR